MRLPATLTMVLRRALANPAPVAAIAINVLVVCVLVSGLSASLALVQQETLSSRLGDEEVAATVVEVTSPYDAEDPALQDQAIRDALTPVVDVAGGEVVTLAESGTFDLRGDAGGSWTFAAVGGGADRLDIGSGQAPETTADGPLQAAAPEGSDLQTGTTLTLTGRSGGETVEVVVTGTWSLPPGSERSFSSLDPGALVVPIERFDEVAVSGTLARWRAVPDLDRLGADDLGALSAAVSRAAVEVEAAGESVSSSVQLDTDLGASLALVARQLTVMRALLLVPAGLLLLVAAAGLVLVAAGLASVRREDESLLRSRGAAQRQLVAPTVLESLVVCGTAALVAPLIATLVVRIGDTRPDLGLPAWLASAGAAAVCALALTVPVAVRALTGDRGEQQSVERQRRRTLTGLLATVLLVAGLGVLGVVTLRRFGDTVASAGVESTQVDLLSVASPALLLLAVAVVVAVVLLPGWFRLLALGFASRGLGPSLGSRFAARAPSAAIPLALTVTLATGVLTFAAVERDSSAAARVARADFVAGADARVVPPASAVRAGVAEERRVLATTPGVRRVTPVHRSGTFVEGLPTQTLMTELSAATVGDLLGPDPGAWERLVTTPWRDPSLGAAIPPRTARLEVSIKGNDDGTVELWFAGPDGEVTVVTARAEGETVRTTLPDDLADGARLLAVRTTIENFGFSIQREQGGPPVTRIVADGEPVTAASRWWNPGGRQVFVTFGRSRLPEPPPVPAAITEGLAAGASVSVGDTFGVTLLGIPSAIEVVAVVPHVRTVADGSEAILVDADTALASLLPAGFGDPPSEWWLDLDGGTSAAVSATLADAPSVAERVITPEQELRRLDDDPSTGGAALGQVLLLTATGCLLVGALLLASVVLLRRRERAEQARRLGAAGGDRDNLLGVVGWEFGLTTGTGVVAGVLAGGLVASVTLVSMTLGPDGGRLVPAPELEIPWPTILLAPVAMAVLPFLGLFWLTRRDHRRGLGLAESRRGR